MLDGMEELSKFFDSVHLIRCKGCFKDFPVIKYTYVACLKVCHAVCLCLT